MKNKKLTTAVFLIISSVLIFYFLSNFIFPNYTKIDTEDNNHWLYNLDKLEKNDPCVNRIIEQIEYLKNEKLSESTKFDHYQVSIFDGQLKDLDISSSYSAKLFRGAIRGQLKNTGVNFAGHYTIVNVGMTGWGENYWVIDRKNGQAFEFPYQAVFLDFKKDSNLIIINPKNQLLEFMKNSNSYFDVCLGGLFFLRYYELRPSYILWENNKAKVIDNPNNTKPVENSFWFNY